jgi:hypothetical protein
VTWFEIGLGAAAMAAALLLVIACERGRAAATRRAAIRRQEFAAEAAMIRAVQGTITAMFDAVRRQP